MMVSKAVKVGFLPQFFPEIRYSAPYKQQKNASDAKLSITLTVGCSLGRFVTLSCQYQNKVLRVDSTPCCRGDSGRWGGSDVKCVHYSGQRNSSHFNLIGKRNLCPPHKHSELPTAKLAVFCVIEGNGAFLTGSTLRELPPSVWLTEVDSSYEVGK